MRTVQNYPTYVLTYFRIEIEVIPIWYSWFVLRDNETSSETKKKKELGLGSIVPGILHWKEDIPRFVREWVETYANESLLSRVHPSYGRWNGRNRVVKTSMSLTQSFSNSLNRFLCVIIYSLILIMFSVRGLLIRQDRFILVFACWSDVRGWKDDVTSL